MYAALDSLIVCECSFTYSGIYMEFQDILNNALHNVTSQKTRIYRTLVADSGSQWENDRSITGVQSALNDFGISYAARLMSLLTDKAHKCQQCWSQKKYIYIEKDTWTTQGNDKWMELWRLLNEYINPVSKSQKF